MVPLFPEFPIITLHTTIFFVTLLFLIATFGALLLHRDFVLILICVELMLLATVLNLLAFSFYFGSTDGEILIILILVIAAAETALVLAIIYNFYTLFQTIDLSVLELHHTSLTYRTN